MILTKTKIKDLVILEPKIFNDERGYFYESYNKNTLKELGIKVEFVQDNQSLSSKGVLRGLHFQKPELAQAKLVRVISGSVLDVAVDIRKDSETYGQYISVLLSDKNHKIFYIPEGFAHGFLTLEDNTIVNYKCSNLYSKEHDCGLMWNDKDINIDWTFLNDDSNTTPIISEKDKNNINFNTFKSPF